MRYTRKARSLGLALVGLLVGMLLITPATAHFTQNTAHLGRHAWNQVIKNKVFTKKQANQRFVQFTTVGMPVAGANVASDGTVRRSFNRFGGAPTVNKIGTGDYTVTFPGMEGEAAFNNAIALVSLNESTTGQITRTSSGGNLMVRTADSVGAAADRAFEVMIFVRGTLGSSSLGLGEAPDDA